MAGKDLPPTFPSIEAFYAADERRRRSGEADYGVWWQDEDPLFRYRISYVQATGEVYRVACLPNTEEWPVEVLAIVPPDEGGFFYKTLEGILEGWADHCGPPDGIAWVRRVLAPWAA